MARQSFLAARVLKPIRTRPHAGDPTRSSGPKSTTFLAVLVFFLVACVQEQAQIVPPNIRYGEDICTQCNMIISDPRFAAGYAYQVGPDRYESLAFDDIRDMLDYADQHPEHQVVAWYVHDHATKEWLDARKAHYVSSSQLVTPMAGGIAATASLARAQNMASALGGHVLDWESLVAKHRAGEFGMQHAH